MIKALRAPRSLLHYGTFPRTVRGSSLAGCCRASKRDTVFFGFRCGLVALKKVVDLEARPKIQLLMRT